MSYIKIVVDDIIDAIKNGNEDCLNKYRDISGFDEFCENVRKMLED